MFRAPTDDGQPRKRVLRRPAPSPTRKIFDQAEAALDTLTEAPAHADVRASGTIRMLDGGCLMDSIERGKQPRTMEQRLSRLNAHILPIIGEVPVTKWRVEHRRRVIEKGSKTLFSQRGKSLAWWNSPVAPEDELWLFVDAATGLPVKPEMHSERWHRVRAWLDENDPDNA